MNRRLLKIIRLFAEYSLFYRALLQKRPVILRSLLIVATPELIPSYMRLLEFLDPKKPPSFYQKSQSFHQTKLVNKLTLLATVLIQPTARYIVDPKSFKLSQKSPIIPSKKAYNPIRKPTMHTNSTGG